VTGRRRRRRRKLLDDIMEKTGYSHLKEEALDRKGPGSVVSIATAYGLDSPGIESRWRRDFPHLSRPALRPTRSPVNGYVAFPGGKVRPGRDADPSPPSSAEV
jgi:hypothetical protein